VIDHADGTVSRARCAVGGVREILAGLRGLALVVVVGCGRIGFDPTGTTDASIVAGCPSTALLCDDFESGDVSRWTGTSMFTNASLTVDGQRPHGGAFALDATVPTEATSGGLAATCFAFPTIATGTLAFRAWVNFGDAQLEFDSFMALWSLPSCVDPDPVEYVNVACDSNGMWDLTDDNSVPNGPIDHPGTTACPPPGVWSCVELDYNFGPPARMQLYVNDAIVVDDAPADPTPSFVEAATGITRAIMSGSHVFVDDVVVDRRHIGCN
jgi:hypothetical protein